MLHNVNFKRFIFNFYWGIHYYVNSRFRFVITFPNFFLLFLLQRHILNTLRIKTVLTDRELLQKLKGSRAEREIALRIIYIDNKEKASSFVLRNQGNEDEAKDVFQEAMIAFYENVRDGKFKGESAIGTYLYSITKFKWLNQIKKDKIREGHHEKAGMESFQESPLTDLIDGERKQGVLQVLDQLGEVCKQLLVENLYHNASMKEIAENGSFSSEQIVRNKKYKCLQRLKELIRAKPMLVQMLKGYG